MRRSTPEPIADGGGSDGGRRILKAAAGMVGVAVAFGFGWWLATGSGIVTVNQVVELKVPPRGAAQEGRPPTLPAEAETASTDETGVHLPKLSPAVDTGSTVAVARASRAEAAVEHRGSTPAEMSVSEPVPALLEPGPSGLLPRISEDGREPWRVYARAFDSRDDRPRLVVIVTGLGLEPVATETAIRRLPGAVTLAFTPYGEQSEYWAGMGRRFGHEILLSLPLESADFPFEDPGPHALLTASSPQENLDRLEFLLSRFSGYVGVAGVMGSKFNKDEEDVRPVLEALRNRGLMYVEGIGSVMSIAPSVATEIGVPRALADLSLDDVPSKASIDRELARLEQIARDRAVAVALARPYPVTLDRLTAWAATLEARDLVLAPVSAVADAQFLP